MVLPSVVDSPTHSASLPPRPARLRSLEGEHASLWDRFVTTHPHGLVYHCWGWRKVLESSFPHIKGHFLALEDPHSGELIGGLPVYLVDSWLLGRRLVSSPFATMSDPLFRNLSDRALLLNAMELLRSNLGASRSELRCFRSANDLQHPSFHPLAFYKQHVLDLQRPESALLSSFSKTAVRQMIGRAEKAGVAVHRITRPEHLRDFLGLLAISRRQLHLPAMPEIFFQNLWQVFFPDHFDGFVAYHNGTPIAATLALHFNRVTTLEYSARDPLRDRNGGNQLAYWHTIRAAHQRGDHAFHFGRTASSNTGLRDFKNRWGTIESDLPIFYSPAAPNQSPESSPPYRFAQRLIHWAPSFLQKPFGRFCYNHLG